MSITQLLPAWSHYTALTILLLLTLVLIGALALQYVLLRVAERWFRRRKYLPAEFNLSKYFFRPIGMFLVSFLILISLPVIELPPKFQQPTTHAFQLLVILSLTWTLIKGARLTEVVLYQVFDTSIPNNLRQRQLRTQIQFVIRLVLVVICLLGFSVTLLTFDSARKFGATLIASAGVASVVIGFAAQRSLSNLIAGFQIAFTQPMRIDDVVIVEKEWGRVEEITLTYVVVKLWDLRRMVLPITYFIEKPFENWTRRSSDILGYSMIYVDYRAPIEEIRKELERIVAGSPLWNKQTCALQVTDCRDNVIELRCLMSSANASDAFDLRCLVREKIIEFLHKNYPNSLPRMRAELNENGPREA